MSKNAHAPHKSIDQRILRTRERLGDALVELVQERPFESITVQDVLDRAEVGRSTFYQHYRDKDDLFLSDVDEFLASFSTMLTRCGDTSDRVAPVRELFEHVAEMRKLYDAMVASGKLHDFMDLAQAHFARGIEQRLTMHPRGAALGAERRAVLAQAYAGSMLSVMTWWLRGGTPGTAAELDEVFHAMVWNGVASDRGSDRAPLEVSTRAR